MKPTHIDKKYWPKVGYTKGDLLAYWHAVAPVALKYIHGRPLALKRYPEGINGPSFFQKNVEDSKAPKAVYFTTIAAKTVDRKIRYAVCNNEETLLYLANMGAIELHPWGSTAQRPSKPNVMIFDLDPGENTTFNDAIAAALALKKILDAIGVKSFPKTSGKRGIHVYVPLDGSYTFEFVRNAAHEIAKKVVEKNQKLASLEVHPKNRKDKVFVDYLRNAFGQTAVAAYSPRATTEATVSMPLAWSEVKKGLKPAQFTIKTAPARLRKKGDVWKGMGRKKANLKAALAKLAKLK